MSLLEVRELKKHFPVRGTGFFGHTGAGKAVRAVDGVSFSIEAGETLGLVGESGCGKSTTGRMMMRLLEPTSGQVLYNGQDIYGFNKRQMFSFRKEMQIIFQDPYSSLDPRMTVREILGEPLEAHRLAKGADKDKKVKELLEIVGLSWYHAGKYPHEFSGGQRQRISIARALALNPKIIICDEPVSALDVSIQSHVLNLLNELQKEFNFTYLFISHALNVIYHVSNRVGVMYLGKLVELADKDTLFNNPLHPYTQALISAIPVADPKVKPQRIVLQGDVPSPINPPSGCSFHTRCHHVMPLCKEATPEFKECGIGHWVACHLVASQ